MAKIDSTGSIRESSKSAYQTSAEDIAIGAMDGFNLVESVLRGIRAMAQQAGNSEIESLAETGLYLTEAAHNLADCQREAWASPVSSQPGNCSNAVA